MVFEVHMLLDVLCAPMCSMTTSSVFWVLLTPTVRMLQLCKRKNRWNTAQHFNLFYVYKMSYQQYNWNINLHQKSE